jgi:hypothetical protein
MRVHHMSMKEIKQLTRHQMFLILKYYTEHLEDDQKFQMKLHGMKPQNQGLDIDGAIPIEYMTNTKM